MSLAIAICAMAAFGFAFHTFSVMAALGTLTGLAREAQRILFDPLLSDDDKEPLVQRASKDMFLAIGRMLVRLGICLAAAIAVIWFAELIGLASFAEIFAWVLSWQLLLAAFAALGVIWWLRR